MNFMAWGRVAVKIAVKTRTPAIREIGLFQFLLEKCGFKNKNTEMDKDTNAMEYPK